ncbi:MAG: membrane protein insertase YidC [Clostridia bacterium]|nr:membrane protein insertase YidC [Clostridia bacterium]
MIESFWDIFYVPLGWLMQLCYKVVPNYGVALLIFALILKVLLSPLSVKQQKNSIKQARLQPYEKAIKKKYGAASINKNPQLQTEQERMRQQKIQEEQGELYQKFGYNPLSGCLPLLIQFPLIIFIYNVIRSPLRYLCGLSVEMVNKIKEVAGVTDEIAALNVMEKDFSKFASIEGLKLTAADLPNFNMFGLDMTVTPQFGANVYLLIPIITFVVVFFSGKLTRKFTYQPPRDEAGASAELSMKILNMTMPLMTVFITFTVPAIVGIYWLYQNVFGVVQQYILSKVFPIPKITEEEYKEAERIVNGRAQKKKKKSQKDPNRPTVRSLHHIDDDDYNARLAENPAEPKKDEKKTVSSFIEPVKMKNYDNKGKK